ncbi:MAG: conjugal transfer protein [bacterium]|nr:conjugal transfer protein [bacterium]
MSITDIVGAPVEDPAEHTVHRTPTCSRPAPPIPSAPPTRGGIGRAWLAVAVLGSIALGMLGGWAVARLAATDPPASSLGQPTAPLPAEVAATAEIFVARYLTGEVTGEVTGTEALYAGDIPGPTGAWINRTAAISGTTTGDGVWNVTVAVDSLEPVDDVFTPVELRYFVVPISTRDGGTFALAAPSRIPGLGEPISEELFSLQVPPDQAAVAARFLEEYLTAGSEIARYVSTPTPIDVFVSAPYTRVEPVVIGADSLGRIKASVVATNESGVVHQLEYTLALELQSGVWVVADLGPAGQ